MHPFFNTTNRVLFLLLAWLVVTFSISSLISTTSGAALADCLLLFTPLYFLCLIFILPNYYVCRGLPLQQTGWLMLIASHLLTLVVIASAWAFVGEAYAGLLDGFVEQPRWQALFERSRLANVTAVAIQFEAIVLMHYLYLALEKSQRLEQEALKQQLLVSQAELQTLKATVHPHFLFNSLNTLSNIALSAPEKAHRFCLLIAEFLRYSVAYSKKPSASLEDELEHVQNYLGIERERFGDRLTTRFEIDESLLGVTVPPLILFPLVENAIKHGIDSCIEGGELVLGVRRHENMLVVELSNPVDELGRKLKGTGHGVTSVEQRLRTRYGGKALLKNKRENGMYSTQLFLPIGEGSDDTEQELVE